MDFVRGEIEVGSESSDETIYLLVNGRDICDKAFCFLLYDKWV